MMGMTHVARHARRMVPDTVQFPLLSKKAFVVDTDESRVNIPP